MTRTGKTVRAALVVMPPSFSKNQHRDALTLSTAGKRPNTATRRHLKTSREKRHRETAIECPLQLTTTCCFTPRQNISKNNRWNTAELRTSEFLNVFCCPAKGCYEMMRKYLEASLVLWRVETTRAPKEWELSRCTRTKLEYFLDGDTAKLPPLEQACQTNADR